MKREQKAEVIEEIAARIAESEAIYAVDYSGLSVAQAAALRASLRESGASFRIVKNTLTLRAADKAGAEHVKELLEGPTAFTFVGPDGGDPAAAAKALDTFGRRESLLEFRGGVLGGVLLSAETIRGIARLPARDQLNAQVAGLVAAPITGLVRGLGSMLSGLAVALGQVWEKKEAEGEAEPQPQGEPEAEPETETGSDDQEQVEAEEEKEAE